MSGIIGTSSRLPGIPGGATVAQPINTLRTVTAAEGASGESLADRIAADATFRSAFVERMKLRHPDETEELRTALS